MNVLKCPICGGAELVAESRQIAGDAFSPATTLWYYYCKTCWHDWVGQIQDPSQMAAQFGCPVSCNFAACAPGQVACRACCRVMDEAELNLRVKMAAQAEDDWLNDNPTA